MTDDLSKKDPHQQKIPSQAKSPKEIAQDFLNEELTIVFSSPKPALRRLKISFLLEEILSDIVGTASTELSYIEIFDEDFLKMERYTEDGVTKRKTSRADRVGNAIRNLEHLLPDLAGKPAEVLGECLTLLRLQRDYVMFLDAVLDIAEDRDNPSKHIATLASAPGLAAELTRNKSCTPLLKDCCDQLTTKITTVAENLREPLERARNDRSPG